MERKPVTFPIETLHCLMICDAERGLLFWKERPVSMFSSEFTARMWNARNAGKPAFARLNREGYCYGAIGGKKALAHRVIWAMHMGVWPVGIIDHINHRRDDNRIENLRLGDAKQSAWNRGAHQGSRSKHVGVTWSKVNQGWMARITTAGECKYLGTFSTEEQAAEAYRLAAVEARGAWAFEEGAV